MLHICTISSRDTYLEEIYKTIPKNKDITWHIAIGTDTSYSLPILLKEDNRVKFYIADCLNTDTASKMNLLFKEIQKIKKHSYFCILDDDTIFAKRMYSLYREYFVSNKQYMIIGKQVDKKGITRLLATLPYECAIDSGNVLCHTSVLPFVKWANTGIWSNLSHEDFNFWNNCFQYFGIKRTDITQTAISIYNFFNPKKDTLDYIRN